MEVNTSTRVSRCGGDDDGDANACGGCIASETDDVVMQIMVSFFVFR